MHTPGPWRADEDSSITKGASDFRLSAKGKYLGSLCEGSDLPDLINRSWLPLKEARANAKLVAAAPDLLSAVQGLLDAVSDLGEDARNEFRESAVEAANAALLKAIGS